MLDKAMEHTIYSLRELCSFVNEAVDTLCPKDCWVRAEISSLSAKNGHCYMELIEKEEHGGLLAAKMRATCWVNVYSMLSSYFIAETGQSLQAGMQVLLCGNVSFHAVYGLSFQVTGIDPSYTLGDIARQRQETIARLQQDGVMDMQKTLGLPSLLQHIAVISSADAAGYEDFCNQLQHNTAHFCYHTELFPASVQGDRAEKSIIEALTAIFERRTEFQAVVIIRGGGATTDLKCFDSYNLAFYCAQFPLPIIAGIGHQRDVSVVDMVAHTSVKTPTAAAEFFINHTMEQQERLNNLRQRLQVVCLQPIMQERQTLMRLQMRIRQAMVQMLTERRTHLQLLQKSVVFHSPERLYKMGYSLTTCQGKPVHSVSDLKAGDELITELVDGKVASIVK